jgi:hypothetical protein
MDGRATFRIVLSRLMRSRVTQRTASVAHIRLLALDVPEPLVNLVITYDKTANSGR